MIWRGEILPCSTLKVLCVHAGTNFLTRSMAFQESGWSPTYTLTEDFALGMYMKANKWHCRYVEEYLAIGEAPDQVRNCFQQRSRWCKVGPFLMKKRGNLCAVLSTNSLLLLTDCLITFCRPLQMYVNYIPALMPCGSRKKR